MYPPKKICGIDVFVYLVQFVFRGSKNCTNISLQKYLELFKKHKLNPPKISGACHSSSPGSISSPPDLFWFRLDSSIEPPQQVRRPLVSSRAVRTYGIHGVLWMHCEYIMQFCFEIVRPKTIGSMLRKRNACQTYTGAGFHAFSRHDRENCACVQYKPCWTIGYMIEK